MHGRILIVDDRFASRLMLSALFSGAYYDVLQSDSDADALRTARRDRPGIIVIADGLSGTGAAGLCESLRRDPDTTDLLRIVITDLPDPSRTAMMIHCGADEVIARSCPDDEVMARIRTLVDHRARVRSLNLRDTPETTQPGLRDAPVDFLGSARVSIVGAESSRTRDWPDAINRAMGRSRSLRISQVEPAASPTSDVDVLLIDAASLGRDGTLRLVAQLARQSGLRTMQMLVAVDPGDRDLGLRALELGADNLLTLPFDAAEAAARIALLLRRKVEITQLHARLRSGLRSAMTDPLTGLYNRRYALPRLDEFVRDARSQRRPASVIMADLDHFKWINDTFGHAAGDTVLSTVAGIIRREADRLGFAARMGGEEFLVALPCCGRLAATAVARRVRAAIEACQISVVGIPEHLNVTASIGVAVAEPDRMAPNRSPSEDTAALLSQADRALYRAKRAGRNRVACDIGIIADHGEIVQPQLSARQG